MNMPTTTQAYTRVTKFLVKDTGTYNPQMRRAYNTNLDASTMGAIVERVHGTDKFNPMLLSGIAGQFIQPTATPERELMIPNGWDTPRTRFMLSLEHEFPGLGSRVTEVVTGFTDHQGITMSGAIDPNMKFYVNSVVQTRSVLMHTPFGTQQGVTVVDNSHVLADNSFGSIYTPVKEHRLRPEDVYSAMSRLNAEVGDAVDMRTVQTNVAVKSRRANALPATYMAGILENHRVAAHNQEFGSGMQDILTSARGNAAEASVVKDPFLSAMTQITGRPASNMFTMNELRQLDPNIDAVAVIGFSGPTQQAQQHHAGQTQHWAGTDRETLVATILSQAVPALMMDLALTVLVFKSTNNTIGSQMLTQPLDYHGFANIDMTENIRIFISQFEAIVLRDITYNNQIGYNLEMRVDLLGETMIRVQLDSGPVIDYVTPSFCDALMTPVLTTDVNQANNVARDFDMLISNVSDQTAGFQAIGQDGQNLFGST